jgi:hypothetical protein
MPKLNFKQLAARTRRRLYLSIPYAAALLAAYGILEDSKVSLWVGLAGVVLGPIQGHVAAANVPPDNDGDGKPDSGG